MIMKIYSSRQQYRYELDKYIGKDVWVLVHCIETGYRRPTWIRILRSLGYSDSTYEANVAEYFYFDEDDEDYVYTGGESAKERILKEVRFLSKDLIEPSNPLELMSTEELFGT